MQDEVIYVDKLSNFKGNHTNYYAINEEKLAELVGKKLGFDHLLILNISSAQNEQIITNNPTKKEITKSNKSSKSEQVDKIIINKIEQPKQQEKTTTSQDMLAYWNESFNGSKLAMSKISDLSDDFHGMLGLCRFNKSGL